MKKRHMNLHGGRIRSLTRKFASLCILATLTNSAMADPTPPDHLTEAINNPHRTTDYVARDDYRHPRPTLEFFGIKPDSTVVEIWPGGGWYSEILGFYLADDGKFIAAHFAENTPVSYFKKSRESFLARVEAEPELFGPVEVTQFFPPDGVAAAEPGSADFVLTFRNVHNWMKAGFAEDAFSEFYSMLKPGGVLGVVEHRAKSGTDLDTMIESGYVTEEYVIKLAEAAGFQLEARAQINANPLDHADHPKGVWTLPPTYALGDEDREKYAEIGESDRMTLKFVKP